MWGDDMTCENCKYYDVDYEWDDDYEEEIEIDVCRKGHEIDFVLKNICPDFKKYKPRRYVEKDTKCDNCEFFPECKENGYVLNCTIEMDNRQHFIPGMGANCKKCGKVVYKK